MHYNYFHFIEILNFFFFYRMENKSFEERQSSGKGFNQALENLQSSNNQIGHIINDRENLVSPEKVHSTQSTLERRMKENQYRDGSYGTLESRKFNDSPDYQYSTLDSQRSRFGSNETSSERNRYPGSDISHSYTITDRTFPTDNSPAQYSSIERKINQESYDSSDRTNDIYETSSKIPLRKNQDVREQSYGGKNPQNQQHEDFIRREKGFESSMKKMQESSHGPPPPPLPQMPRSPVRKNIHESSFGKFTQEQNYHEDKQTSFEKRSNETLDPSYFPTPGTTSTIVNERFSTSTPMGTFRSEKSSDQQIPPRSYIATAGVPQNQTYKNVDTKVTPGGRIETITTKIYTSTPGNSSTSTNLEKMEKNEFSTSCNDMSTFKALDTGNKESLEQRTIKQSTLQKVTEKKTVTMTTSKRHESNTKSFRFEEKK